MTLTLGFSPCPNDTFIFDAMIHNRIDTEGVNFEVIMEDVENLNQKAFRGDLDITKLSYHAYAYLTDKYVLLDAGSALGNNCGPLLISKNESFEKPLSAVKVAIPGKYTTANFLFSLAYPDVKNKQEMVFHEIEDAVLRGDVDAGVIIHENRFTYQLKGLKKIIDLGEFWEGTTGLPIPLGGIVVKRDLPDDLKNKINRIMERSVRFAFDNPEVSKNFVKQNAQEMDEKVMQQHIDLYVNHYTENLGENGKKAVNLFFETAIEKKIIPNYTYDIFLN
jgi:1,4-dihydroxy-6-naphthoate synthase